MSQIVLQHYARPAARRQLWVGLVMLGVTLGFATHQLGHWLAAHPAAQEGLLASLLAGLATGLGALPLFLLRRPAPGAQAPLLGLAGGMMLAASLFSLLLPAVALVAGSAAPGFLGLLTTLALLAGAGAMQAIDGRTEHAHVERITMQDSAPRLGLIVAAIALHNVPEGLAVGVAVASGGSQAMTLGIALQNIPEGWIVASALLVLGATPIRAAFLALATGLVEPLGGLIGVIAGSVAGNALPLALAAAAGAMLWVVSHELIPASHQSGRERAGTAGLLAGFAIMTTLATLL